MSSRHIIDILRELDKLGVSDNHPLDKARGIMLSNQISLLGVAVSLALAVLHGLLAKWNSVPMLCIAVGIGFMIPLISNANGKTMFSRIFLSIYLPTSILLISIISKILSTQEELRFEGIYYTYHFFLTITSIGVLGLFEPSLKKWVNLFSIYIAILIALFNPIHNAFNVGYYQTGHTDPNYFFATIVVLLAYGAMFGGVTIMKRNIEKNEKALLSEIEERKKVEVEIRKAKELAIEASAAKSEFLANVSHELRTPLNGIIGFSDLVLKTPLDTTQNKYVTILSKSAHSLLDIVNDILDFSKIEAGKLRLEIEKCNLAELAKHVVEDLSNQAEQKNLTLKLSLSPECPSVIMVDPVRLKQVLINLIGNSIKFTHQGEIELSIQLQSKNYDGGVTIRFAIKDTGIGINLEDQQRIFEAFAQADVSNTKKYGGTGLGLSICNSLLSLMNSKLDLKSKVGEGSEFSFVIVTRSKL